MLFVGAPKDLSPERIQRWLDDLPASDIRDAYRGGVPGSCGRGKHESPIALTPSSRRYGSRAALKPCKRSARPVINCASDEW